MEFSKKTLAKADISGKVVLIRVDFNVPLEAGKVADDTRIKAALPTLNHLVENENALILISHLGRPGGKRDEEYSLAPVAQRLGEILNREVKFANDCLGPAAADAVKALQKGEILLLENTRFHPGEKENDPGMAEELASFADVFVNDAFGTAHRAHASNVGVAKYLPSYAGNLLEKEIVYLGKTIQNPEKPFTAVLGGAKVSGKIGVIKNLLPKADHILIGGGMANTFFKAQGYDMADSLVEGDALETAEELLGIAGGKLILPVDIVLAEEFSPQARKQIIELGDVPAGWRVMDVGPKTIKLFGDVVSKSKTVVWNGPMGVFEFERFAEGTFKLAEIIAESECVSIIGGGDSAAAVKKAGLQEQITHISTGGGASLQMLAGEELPGLEALDSE
jgi:phosphoglycerate kinase